MNLLGRNRHAWGPKIFLSYDGINPEGNYDNLIKVNGNELLHKCVINFKVTTAVLLRLGLYILLLSKLRLKTVGEKKKRELPKEEPFFKGQKSFFFLKGRTQLQP